MLSPIFFFLNTWPEAGCPVIYLFGDSFGSFLVINIVACSTNQKQFSSGYGDIPHSLSDIPEISTTERDPSSELSAAICTTVNLEV